MTATDDKRRDGQSEDVERLEREAIAWVQRMTSGTATASDAEALKSWRSQSPAHAAAFVSARHLWTSLGSAGQSWRRRQLTRSPVMRATRTSPAMSRRFLLGGGAAAATAAGVYGLFHPPLNLWPSWMELQADYRTGTGEQRDVSLSSGVSIRMNTQTSIVRQQSDNNTERVQLVTGEASFSTSAREGREGYALAVLAADRWIVAQRARFDVRHLSNQTAAWVCVTCLSGEVDVRQGTEEARIRSGQQLSYGNDGLGRIVSIDPETLSAWQRGVLIFRSTPLSDVVDEVNRYRPGRIVVTNSELGRLPVSGQFQINDLDEFLIQLGQAFGAKVRALPGGLVLLS